MLKIEELLARQRKDAQVECLRPEKIIPSTLTMSIFDSVMPEEIRDGNAF
jgi:hypothetical protein